MADDKYELYVIGYSSEDDSFNPDDDKGSVSVCPARDKYEAVGRVVIDELEGDVSAVSRFFVDSLDSLLLRSDEFRVRLERVEKQEPPKAGDVGR